MPPPQHFGPLKIIGKILDWTTPRQQLYELRDNPGTNCIGWESYRDNICRKWVNLNIMCGLVMGGISTILFSEYPLSPPAFALGVVSLLGSLIAIGFGVGLIYVLGDLKGSRYQILMEQHPTPFIFALMIPQIWSLVSFLALFFALAVLLWQATDQSVVIKIGVVISIGVVIVHIIGFSYVFRPDDASLYSLEPLQVLPQVEEKDKHGQGQGQGQSANLRRRETVFGVEVGRRAHTVRP